MMRPFVKSYEDEYYLDFVRTLEVAKNRTLTQALTKLKGTPYFYGTATLSCDIRGKEVTFLGCEGGGPRGRYLGLRPLMRWFDRLERRYL